MENNTYENGFAPEAEEVQQPVQEQEVYEQPVQPQEDYYPAYDQAPTQSTDVKSVLLGVWEKIKALPKKVLALAGAGVALVVVLAIVLSMLGNTYKTPVKEIEKLLNKNSAEKIIDGLPAVLNGFGESEAKDIIKILKKSDSYKDMEEDMEDYYDEIVEGLKDEYGKNYKIDLKIEDKEKLEKEDLRSFRNQLRDIADYGEELDDMDSDDYEDMADDLGISKSKAKKMVKSLKSFCKDCKSAKVKAGYELSVLMTIDGKDADEPLEQEFTVNVYKVDGRWVIDVFSLVSELGLGSLSYLF